MSQAPPWTTIWWQQSKRKVVEVVGVGGAKQDNAAGEERVPLTVSLVQWVTGPGRNKRSASPLW